MILKRIANTEHGTFGILLSGGIPFAVTLENPWINNKENESCIPIGQYICKKYRSFKHGKTYEIIDVPNRGHGEPIIFHKGNTDSNTRGCILVGEEFGILDDEPAILRSGNGFKEFLNKIGNKNWFNLIIMDV